MIHFNELYITEDGKKLVVDAEIDDFNAYKDCYISGISVQAKKDCVSTEPYNIVFPKDEYIGNFLMQDPLIVVDLDKDGKITWKDEQ